MYKEPQESEVSFWEYFFILTLVVIVVITALTVLGPKIDKLFTTLNESQSLSYSENANILAEVSLIGENTHPTFLDVTAMDIYHPTWIQYDGCYKIDTYGKQLKIVTTYSDPSIIDITRNEDSYFVCNSTQGTQIEVIYTLIEVTP